jgi:hypothetical protein
VHGSVRSSLLGESDDGVEDEDGDDDRRVGVLLEQQRDDGRDQQDDDEGALELAHEQDEVADGLLRVQPVLAVRLEPFGHGALVQSPSGGVESLEDLVGAERVPRRARW